MEDSTRRPNGGGERAGGWWGGIHAEGTRGGELIAVYRGADEIARTVIALDAWALPLHASKEGDGAGQG